MPPSALRHLTQFVVESSTYGSQSAVIPTVDTSHTLLCHEEPDIKVGEFLFDGNLPGMNPGGSGTRGQTKPVGRKGSASLKYRQADPGTAYTLAAPPPLVKLLRTWGMAATFTAGGTPKWELVPVSTGFASGALDVYKHDQIFRIFGAYMNSFAWAIKAHEPAEWTFGFQGMAERPDAAALPAIGYSPSTRNIPVAITTDPSKPVMLLTSGAEAVRVRIREGTLKGTRTLTERINGDESGLGGYRHPGFVMGPRTIEFEGTVEATDRTSTSTAPYANATARTFDPNRMFEEAQQLSVALQVGSLVGSGIKATGANVFLKQDAEPDKDGVIPLWKLNLRFDVSAEHLDDDLLFLIQ